MAEWGLLCFTCWALLHSPCQVSSRISQKAPQGGIRRGGKLFGRADLWPHCLGFILLNTSCWKVTAEQLVLPISIPSRAREEKWKKKNHLPWIFMTWGLPGGEVKPTLRSLVGLLRAGEQNQPFSLSLFYRPSCAPNTAETNVIPWVLLWKRGAVHKG